MERGEKNALYFIKKKINNNHELLIALQHIYEDEKSKGSLVQKKEITKAKDKFDRYLSSCLFNEYTEISLPLLTYMFLIPSCLSEPALALFGFILCPFLFFPVFDMLSTGYKQQKVKNGFLKYSKKTMKSYFASILNRKNSAGRRKYELYANELSLRSLEEISKYISKEEMDVILKAKLDYESLNIYQENFKKIKEYKDINKYIENDLNMNIVRNNLLENIYKDKN